MTPAPAEQTAASRHPLIDKLALYADLDDSEVAAITDVLPIARSIPHGRDLVVQGQPYHVLYVLRTGLGLRYRVLTDGRRQVLNLIVPGDLIGLPAGMFETAIASVSCLTDVVVSPIEFHALFGLFRRCPRVGVALFWTAAREAAIYAERLASIGRRSAYERLAHLILELLTRLQAVGLAEGASFRMPLTQEMLADALGLSLQHINRMVRNLREEGLASIEEHTITIHDLDSLARLAGFENLYLTRQRIPGL
jgi:CRP-like cAMP-binding protein